VIALLVGLVGHVMRGGSLGFRNDAVVATSIHTVEKVA